MIIALSLLTKTTLGQRLGLDFKAACALSVLGALVVGGFVRAWMAKTVRKVDEEGTEEIFRRLQVVTSCYVALAHGANDVANAVGPMAAIFSVAKTNSVVMKVEVPLWMLAIGGLFVGAGIFAFGKKVMETIGRKITEITPVRGFCAEAALSR